MVNAPPVRDFLVVHHVASSPYSHRGLIELLLHHLQLQLLLLLKHVGIERRLLLVLVLASDHWLLRVVPL